MWDSIGPGSFPFGRGSHYSLHPITTSGWNATLHSHTTAPSSPRDNPLLLARHLLHALNLRNRPFYPILAPLPTSPFVDVHTPTTSFALPHSLQQDTLQNLYDRLTTKLNLTYPEKVGPGWVKYDYNGSIWSLDDDADHAIFTWRHITPPPNTTNPHAALPTPCLHVHPPNAPLPQPPAYRNAAYYAFRPSTAASPGSRPASVAGTKPKSTKAKSAKSAKSKKSNAENGAEEAKVPEYKRQFEEFHGENGVRTVLGSIGPVSNVRMLLKKGYRHVYISRTFARKHGFIPKDAAPGMYGYSGLVNLGQWPITVGTLTIPQPVYLSEETHFDVVLGRSFMERRGVRTDPLDMTSVHLMDTGEKIDCDVVVIRDGRGQIVTVT